MGPVQAPWFLGSKRNCYFLFRLSLGCRVGCPDSLSAPDCRSFSNYFPELKTWDDRQQAQCFTSNQPNATSLQPDAIRDQTVSEGTGDRQSTDVHIQLWLSPLTVSNKLNLGAERNRFLRKKKRCNDIALISHKTVIPSNLYVFCLVNCVTTKGFTCTMSNALQKQLFICMST